MNELSVVANPLGAAQSRLLCSPRRHLQVAVAYPLIAAAIAMIIFRAAQPMSFVQLAGGTLPVLLVIQGAVLAVVATAAIRRAVLRDFTTGMIDSHRLTAMTGSTLVLGYLTGPTSQALLIAVENYVIGLLACRLLPANPWLEWTFANLFIASAAFPIWSASLVLALATQGRGSLGGLLFAFAVLGGFALVRMVPAFLLIAGPLLLFLKFSAIAAGVTPPRVLLLGLPIQAALGLTFCLAAARKVRRGDVQTFGAWLGLILLAECAAICVASLYFANELIDTANLRRVASVTPQAVLLASVMVSYVIAFVPIAAAAQAVGRWRRRRRLDPDFADPRPVTTFTVYMLANALLGVAVLISLRLAPGFTGNPASFFGYLALGLLSMAGFFRRAYARRDSVFILGIVFFVVLWVAPVVAEVIWYVYTDSTYDHPEAALSPLMAFSPAGAAYVFLQSARCNVWPGLLTQLVVAAALWLLPISRRDRPVSS